MVAQIVKKRFETEDQYATARENIDKYYTYNIVVGKHGKASYTRSIP